MNLPLYDESSFWRGARSSNVSPIELRGSLNRLHSLSTNSTNRHSTGGNFVSVKHAFGSAVNLSRPIRHTHHHHPIRSQNPLRYETTQDDASLHTEIDQGNSCSSSDTESQDRSKIPRYNSQILGTSTRSLIQQVNILYFRGLFLVILLQVYIEEGLDRLAQDDDLLSMTGTEIADCYNMSLNELESAAEEVC